MKGMNIMMKKALRGISALLTATVLLGSFTMSFAATASDIDSAVSDTAAYIVKTVPSPRFGSIGGEWAIMGLARSDCKENESYYGDYYSAVESYVKACGGVLSGKKYTEYSRLVLALTAIGVSPTNVAGYNLFTPLGDYDKTIWQGINGPAFALIALDSGNYSMPVNSSAKTQATRDMYVENILSLQLSNGGFAESGTSAEPDITAMVLQALSKYKSRADVSLAIDKALICLSGLQDGTGGFSGSVSACSESVSQAIVALGELGISLDDKRFVKNGYSLADNLLKYYTKGGGFKHLPDDSTSDEMATEQAFYALVSAQRSIKSENSLYDMSDAISVLNSDGTGPKAGAGLTGKNADVKAQAITAQGKTFSDISGTNEGKYETAIEALTSRSIIGGYDDGTFKPENPMTRAEFAAITVRALGLTPKTADVFNDVSNSIWYASYVGTAYTYGIVYGKSTSTFDPSGTITRQEAAVMVARAAKLCGMDTSLTVSGIRDILAQFDDYTEAASWAQESLAFCYCEGISDQSELEIQPTIAITRGEIAQMLYNMLGIANLL